MSWAAVAQQAKDLPPKSSEPKCVVIAPDATVTDAERQHNNPDHVTAHLKRPKFEKGLLVLDANAFIKGLENLTQAADALVTIPEVVREIRDRASKDMLEHLPRPLTVLDPTTEAISEVMDVAAKTGDLGVLSRTDIRLCALAVDCCTLTGSRRASIDPRPAVINPDNALEKGVTVVSEAVEEMLEEHAEPDSSGADESDSSSGEWITPENITRVVNGTAKPGSDRYNGGVVCVTSDYAMQNTLMHLGVPIVGTQGLQIKELRLWLMRCTACFTVTPDTTRQFCQECGAGDTLKRVSYVVNEQGEKSLFINFKKRISTRGTVYNLPKPRGGHRGTNKTLVLREDQLAHFARGGANASRQAKEKLVHQDDELAAFGEGPAPKKRNYNQSSNVSSYQRRNVNEYRKARAGKKK